MGKRILAIFLAFVMLMEIPTMMVSANETATLESKGEDYTVEGTSAFGNLLSDDLLEEVEEQEATEGNCISSLKIEGKKARVNFATTTLSTLVIAIYEEDGPEMLGFGSVDVTAEDKEVEVDIEIDTMPTYFMVRGYLIERDTLKPLSTVYNCTLYTQEMQEFLSKTVDDFDEELVLNLDENGDTNFVVYTEGTIQIPYVENQNVIAEMDEENGRYVIENATSEVTSLQRDDVFSYCYDGQHFLIVKVASISVDGTTVTITEADVEMEDVFDYVKIESEGGTSDAQVNNDNLVDGLTYNGKISEQQPNQFDRNGVYESTTGEDKLEYTMAEIPLGPKDNPVSGTISGKLTFTIEYYLTRKHKYVQFLITYEMGFEASVEGKVEGEVEIGEISVFPVPGIEVGFTPALVARGTLAITVKATISGQFGFRYDSIDHLIQNLTEKPIINPTVSGEFTFFVGVAFKPFVGVIDDDIFKLELVCEAGGELKAKLFEFQALEDDSEIHDCEVCIEGTIHLVLRFGAQIVFLDDEDSTFGKTFTWSTKLADFYVSIDRGEADLTTCPHILYKRTIEVVDTEGNPISGAKIKEIGLLGDYEATTDDEGKSVEYRKQQVYYLKISKVGYIEKRLPFVLAVGGKKIKVKLTKDLPPIDPIIPTIPDDPVDPEEPEQPVVYTHAIDIAITGNQYAVLTDENQLLVWRDGVPTYQMADVKKIYANGKQISAIRENGDFYQWEVSKHPRKPILTNVKEYYFFDNADVEMAICENGDLYVWGHSCYGELGLGEDVDDVSEPTLLLENIKEVRSYNLNGTATLYAIGTDNKLYMWGNNLYGGSEENIGEICWTPVCILEEDVASFDYYNSVYAVVTTDGKLYMWGYAGDDCRFGNEKRAYYKPTLVRTNVESISLGYGYVLALTQEKDLYVWGYDWEGYTPERYTYEPKKIFSNVKDATMYGNNFYVLKENGELYAWGIGGQLGTGDGEPVLYENRQVILTQVDLIECSESGNRYAITTSKQMYV